MQPGERSVARPSVCVGIALAILIGGACSDTTSGPEPNQADPSSSPDLQFTLRAEARVSLRPEGVAVSPDGSQVVVATFWGDEVFLLDGETYALLRPPIPSLRSWGVDISAEGRFAFVAAKKGSVIIRLPGGEVESYTGYRARRWTSDRTGLNHYTSAMLQFADHKEWAMIRTNSHGRILARSIDLRLALDNYNFTLSDDERDMIVIVPAGRMLVMDPVTMDIRDEVDVAAIPHRIMVPLRQPHSVALIGSQDATIIVTAFDYQNERVLGQERVDAVGDGPVWFGFSDPWTRVLDRFAMPTTHGLLTIDSTTGFGVRLYRLETPDSQVACCDVTFDPLRDRLIVVGRAASASPEGLWGRALVYDVSQIAE